MGRGGGCQEHLPAPLLPRGASKKEAAVIRAAQRLGREEDKRLHLAGASWKWAVLSEPITRAPPAAGGDAASPLYRGDPSPSSPPGP